MKVIRLALIIFCLLILSAVCAAGFEEEFHDPPEWTRPWCYWFFMDGDITKEGITKDMEKMKEIGIQQAIIMYVQHSPPKAEAVEILSDRWMQLQRFAFKEAARCGIGISMHNCPGWSNAGGPWIKPEQSMRHITWKEFQTHGGEFSKKVCPADLDSSQDIAVLALPEKDHVSVVGVRDSGESAILRFAHTSFMVDSKLLKKDRRVYLDLGRVNVMAAVTINGKTLPTLWMPPFKADITDLLKKGRNKINLEITSTARVYLRACLGLLV